MTDENDNFADDDSGFNTVITVNHLFLKNNRAARTLTLIYSS